MKKFEGLLICTDIDGTLLASDKTISKENLDAIERFKAGGGIFTFITGRMPFTASNIYEEARANAPYGCINGGGLYDPVAKKYLWRQELERSALDLVDCVDRQVDGIGIQTNTFDGAYFFHNNSAMEYFREVTGLPNIVKHYRDVDEPLAKIVFGDDDEEHIERIKDLLNSHPRASEFDFIRSEKRLYEILPPNTNKGTVLPILAKHVGVDMRRTIAVGDYNNDVGMLKAAGLGIAVANAVEEAKAAADLITVSNDEHAIAQIINDIESGKISI